MSSYQKPIKHSYGVACCRYNLAIRKMEILMVKKRYTFYYVEFILGHYASTDDNKILYLFDRMANEEKLEIESKDFDRMWVRIWREKPTNSDADMYIKYLKCKRKFEHTFSNPHKLLKLLSASTSSDFMWEIPKGHRNAGETELGCAMREFSEETELADYMIIPEESIEMQYTNNKAQYIYKFFLGLARQDANPSRKFKLRNKQIPDDIKGPVLPPLPSRVLPPLGNSFKNSEISKESSKEKPWHRRSSPSPNKVARLNFANHHQLSEIIDVRWVTQDDLRFLDQSKRFYNLVRNIFKILRSRYRIPKLTQLGMLPF